MSEKSLPEGGCWLAADTAIADAFFPEDFSEDHLALRGALDEFVKREVAPHAKGLESHDHTLLLSVMAKAGENGFLGIEIPAEYGGAGLGLISSTLAFERMSISGSASFMATFGVHTGIGTAPLMLYGSEALKQKYLPRIASGECITAYALTEPGSGSDALAAKTTAKLSGDKTRWIVNGDKLFITNGGLAHLVSVFVKAEGQNACLLYERGPNNGFSVGKEEDKVGLHGSSTCPLTFENTLIEASNLIGEVGKGHKIVMNTLNIGRLKLAGAKIGLIKKMMEVSCEHASTRSQFGKKLIEFEAIRAKLANMAMDAWVGEAMVYRTAKLVEDRIHADAPIEQLSQECALVKVALSEWGCNAADEAMQIHGGVGYTEEYLVARAWRDSRISRIYEGTSEINRFAVIAGLGQQVKNGKLNVFGAPPSDAAADAFDADVIGRCGANGAHAVYRAKATVRFLLGTAMMTHMQGLAQEQQLLLELADAVTAVYAMESAHMRFDKAYTATKLPPAGLAALLTLCLHKQAQRIERACEAVLAALPNDRLTLPYALRLLGRTPSYDEFKLRRDIAAAVVDKGGYPY